MVSNFVFQKFAATLVFIAIVDATTLSADVLTSVGNDVVFMQYAARFGKSYDTTNEYA